MDDLFTNDRQLTGAGFSEELTPFPNPEPQPQPQFFYPHSTTPVPQKLRPIRSNDSSFLRINGSNSSDLGFLPFQPDFTTFQDDTSASAHQLLKIKSDMDAHLLSNFKSQISNLDFSSFSSSSDCSDDSAHKGEEERSSNGKPKKKRRKKMESFLQGLMSQVINKQEEMHQQLMNMIENKEKQRIVREEAWRRQELERANRDHQIRAQEAARNVALITFIRNALGVSELQVPDLLSFPSGEDSVADTQSLGQGEQERFDPNYKRWPTSEVQALITLRAALDQKFHTIGAKAPVWDEVAAGMAKMGYTRSARKCKEKWENVNKYYKKATGNGKKYSENAKSCPYFHELETLYKNRLITATKSNSPSNEDSEQNANV